MATKDEFQPSKIPASVECCMCGDHGLSQELFRCRICLSRFQHRYCSNLYPKTGTYKVCNWCISKQGDKLQRSQSSLSFTYRSNTSSTDEGEEVKDIKKKMKRNIDSIHGSSKKEKRGLSQVHHTTIKKQVHSDQSIARKKMVYRGEKMLRRTKSEGTVNGGMIKQFRGKVQRYKLLEEVSVR
ncbi:hypothetical protein ACHQM5_024127 [Ranunculus cassubicifolius]